eukprot:6262362-Prymnesium_polylepis.1
MCVLRLRRGRPSAMYSYELPVTARVSHHQEEAEKSPPLGKAKHPWRHAMAQAVAPVGGQIHHIDGADFTLDAAPLPQTDPAVFLATEAGGRRAALQWTGNSFQLIAKDKTWRDHQVPEDGGRASHYRGQQ